MVLLPIGTLVNSFLRILPETLYPYYSISNMYILVRVCVCVYTQLGSYHNTVQDLLPPQLKCNLYAFLYQYVQICIICK